ncbi:MAG: Yip1 family protein, partial [Acidobacteriota bacterium]
MEQILERIKVLLLNPKQAWESIREEPTTSAEIIRGYLIYLAVVPALSAFIGRALVGYPLVPREPVGRSFLAAIFYYLLTLFGVWVLAQVVNWLATNFGGNKNPLRATKLAVYSSTPYLVGGIFLLIPSLSILHLLASLYGVYLIY